MNQKSELLILTSITAIFVVFGLAMIFFGWSLYSEQQKMLSWGIETEGQIVGLRRIGVAGKNRLHDANLVPVVIFRTESGEEVTFMGAIAERFWTNYQMSQAVTVIYDPEKPYDARINELAEIRFAPAIFFLIGLGAALIPTYTIWRHHRS